MKNYLLTSGTLSLLLVFAASSFAQQVHPQRDENFRVAVEACVQEKGITLPARGEAPTEEGRLAFDALDACLKEKGITPPKKGPGHHHGPRRDQTSE